MSTTTIRIPDELKARVAAVAEQTGVTSHSFILQAITEKTQQEELRRDFENEAEKRYAKIIATGETVSWKEMRGYLENYAAGNTAAGNTAAGNTAAGNTAAVKPAVKKLGR